MFQSTGRNLQTPLQTPFHLCQVTAPFGVIASPDNVLAGAAALQNTTLNACNNNEVWFLPAA